ncbi:hypothetical protein [Salinirubrum litoreum]|uniref:Uncharacterized protein n=1 Tax=Salinirubrum litoreum TaxID=1126234 RepID=A0ABD5R6G8_9EURY|nr:hypothetical protein [Salinirubrum litoreum]
MVEHTPHPDDYHANDELEKNSPLTDKEREVFRNKIRNVVLGVEEETTLGEIEYHGISSITLRSFRDESTLTVSVYVDADEADVEVDPAHIFGEEVKVTDSAEAYYLRDLGDDWEALEFVILNDLVMLLDLPETPSELADYLLDGEKHGTCLVCGTRMPDSAEFGVVATIPETTRRIYENAEFELARNLRIPIDGAQASDDSDSQE